MSNTTMKSEKEWVIGWGEKRFFILYMQINKIKCIWIRTQKKNYLCFIYYMSKDCNFKKYMILFFVEHSIHFFFVIHIIFDKSFQCCNSVCYTVISFAFLITIFLFSVLFSFFWLFTTKIHTRICLNLIYFLVIHCIFAMKSLTRFVLENFILMSCHLLSGISIIDT